MIRSRSFAAFLYLPVLAWVCAFGAVTVRGQWVVMNSGTVENVRDVVGGAGEFVAVEDPSPGWSGPGGATGYVLRSADGRQWERIATDGQSFAAVGYGQGRYVALGANAVISTDGWNWDAQPVPDGAMTVFPRGVAYGAGRFVSVGTAGRIQTSTHGTAWVTTAAGLTTDAFTHVIYANGRFVAVGIAGAVATSTDGLAWTLRALPERATLTGICFGRGKFVGMSTTGALLASPDTVAWTDIGSLNIAFGDIGSNGEIFVACARGGKAYESLDLVRWAAIPTNVTVNLNRVAFMGSRCVVVGNLGVILSKLYVGFEQSPPAQMVALLGAETRLESKVSAEGSYTVKWQKNGRDILGANGLDLDLGAVALKDAGTYTVLLQRGSEAHARSTVLGVVDGAARVLQVAVGKKVTLAVPCSGTLPPFEWRREGAPAAIAGATQASLVIPKAAVTDAGGYVWRVGDVVGEGHELRVLSAAPDYDDVKLDLPDGIVSGMYDFTLPQSNNKERESVSYAAKGLPAGLKVDAKTGRIAGLPKAVSKDPLGYAVTVTFGNEKGKTSVTARLLIHPPPLGMAGSFNGLVGRGTDLGGALGGRLDVTVAGTAACTGKLVLGGETFNLVGALSLDVSGVMPAAVSFTLRPRSGPAEGLRVDLVAAPGFSEMVISRSGGAVSGTAWRNGWTKERPAEAFKGYYTCGWPLQTRVGDATVPQGTGYGSFTIAPATGKLTLVGRMADGESFTCASFVSAWGEALVWGSLYKSAEKGSVVGLWQITPGAAADGRDTFLEGDLGWQRPPDARTRVYAGGFPVVTLRTRGGRYLPPVAQRGELVMGLPEVASNPPGNGVLRLSPLLGTDRVAVVANVLVQIKAGGAVVLPPKESNPKQTTLSVTPATGAFKGSYVTVDDNPLPVPALPRVISRKVTFQGLMFNDRGTRRALGFLLRSALPSYQFGKVNATPIDSGWMRLEPR